MKTIFSAFIGLLILIYSPVSAQDVPGCTDPQASNYNPQATVNDGSCTYSQTLYIPPLLYQLPVEVQETSGLIVFNGGLWTINDSGNSPVLYHLDTLNGLILQQITVSQVLNIDWESLAQDDDYIYIGDFGNNEGLRDDLGIYRVKKSDLPETGDGQVDSEHISYVYSDFSGQPETWRETNFDCEALIATADSLYLFSKNWIDQTTNLYRLPKYPGTYVAELIGSFNTQGLVTGADYNENSHEITLIGYTTSYMPFLWILFDFSENQFFSGNKRRIDMPGLFGAQTEGIAYGFGKNGYISNEGNILYAQSARSFYTGTWTDTVETGISPNSETQPDFLLKPNPIKKGKLTLIMMGFASGTYKFEVYDMNGSIRQSDNCEVDNDKSECKIKIPVDSLSAGTYFVRVYTENAIIERKFIKQ